MSFNSVTELFHCFDLNPILTFIFCMDWVESTALLGLSRPGEVGWVSLRFSLPGLLNQHLAMSFLAFVKEEEAGQFLTEISLHCILLDEEVSARRFCLCPRQGLFSPLGPTHSLPSAQMGWAPSELSVGLGTGQGGVTNPPDILLFCKGLLWDFHSSSSTSAPRGVTVLGRKERCPSWPATQPRTKCASLSWAVQELFHVTALS